MVSVRTLSSLAASGHQRVQAAHEHLGCFIEGSFRHGVQTFQYEPHPPGGVVEAGAHSLPPVPTPASDTDIVTPGVGFSIIASPTTTMVSIASTCTQSHPCNYRNLTG